MNSIDIVKELLAALMFIIVSSVIIYIWSRMASLAYFKSKREFANSFTRQRKQRVNSGLARRQLPAS